MTKEEYLQQLMSKNNYCSCPQLSDLSKLRKESEKLEKICNEFDSTLDFENPKKEDLDILLDYLSTRKKFEANIEKYNSQLSSLLNKGYLKLNLHTYKGSWKKRKISTKYLEKLSTKSLVTINCASCNQQIDILNSYEFIGVQKKGHTHKE
jgi:RNAse (barnase) inhibitor barstar